MSGKIFIEDSTCYDNHLLLYRCRQMKRRSLLHSASFFSIFIKVCENSEATKIKDLSDVEKVLNIENT